VTDVLFALVTALTTMKAWRSRRHADGLESSMSFVVGVTNPLGEVVTTVVVSDNWSLFDHCETLESAPVCCQATDDQSRERIRDWVGYIQGWRGVVGSTDGQT
jgi:hypothetical protein